ncbi:MAG: MFS transporter [Alicyclobacillus sp.]|nr:MFS transporter [Alicyclobacillus sp.]
MIKRNVFYVLTASFLSAFGGAMYFVVIAWVLYSITKNPTYTGLLVGLGFLPGLFLNLVFGVIVDRFDRKGLALFANLIITVALLLALIAIGLGFIKVWMIFVVHMLNQVTSSLFRPAVQAFVTEAFSSEELPAIFSQSGAASSLGSMLGSAIGGVIVAAFSTAASMATVVICYILATIALILIKRTSISNKGEKTAAIISEFIAGFTYLKGNTLLLGLFTMMLVGQLVFHTGTAFLSVYVKEFLHKSVQLYGLLDSTMSIGGIVAGFLGTWWWRKTGKSVAVGSFLFVGIGLLFIGLSPTVAISFVGVFLIGIGTTWVRVLLQSAQQMATDPQYYGRMASFRMLCNQGSVVIGGPVIGWVASHYGVGNAYLILLIPVGAVIVFAIFQRNTKSFVRLMS